MPQTIKGRFIHSELPSEADFFFKERRRLRITLIKERKLFPVNYSKIENIKIGIKEATKKIKNYIATSFSDRLKNRIENINNNSNRFREIRSIQRRPAGNRNPDIINNLGITETRIRKNWNY